MRFECDVIVDGTIFFTADEECLHDLYVSIAEAVCDLGNWYYLGHIKEYNVIEVNRDILRGYINALD